MEDLVPAVRFTFPTADDIKAAYIKNLRGVSSFNLD